MRHEVERRNRRNRRDEYAKNIGRSEHRTALEAAWLALADAGVDAADVDGIFQVEGQTGEPWELARRLGLPELRAWGTTGEGGGDARRSSRLRSPCRAGCATSRSRTARGNRGSAGRPWAATEARLTDHRAFDMPQGLVSPVQQIGAHGSPVPVRERCIAVGVRPGFSGASSARDEEPRAVFRDPISVDDVLTSRMISDPLHLLDCCPESDGRLRGGDHVGRSGARLGADAGEHCRRRPGSRTQTGMMTNLHAPDPFTFQGHSAAVDLTRRGPGRLTSMLPCSTTTSRRSCCTDSKRSDSADAGRPRRS